jgi:hypothetical protein
MCNKDLQAKTFKYNQDAFRVAKGQLENQPIRRWSFQYKYDAGDPRNFVEIPAAVSI